MAKKKRSHLKKMGVNRNYKDTVFRKLFSDRKNLLSLYNAISETSYTDENELEIVTLESAIYMGIKNDLAFIIDTNLFLFEHQSTYNPNMPLRDLFYISSEYQKLVDQKSIYSSVLLKLPEPHFIVFYNGTAKMPLNAAVKQAVDNCIQEGILEDFLRTNRAEVIAVSIFEYNKEEEELKLRKAEYEAGITEGEARLSTLITLLLNDGKEAEIQQVLTNPVFREEMYKKYGKF